MIQARDGRSFYGPDMRDARQLRLPQRLQELVAEDPMRRSGEFLMACTLLVLTLPLMLITALAIKWESSGPVFERRERIGRTAGDFKFLAFGRWLRRRDLYARPGNRPQSVISCRPLGSMLCRSFLMCCAAR